MIRTLVVDDDFHVAHIHAASIEKIEGFTCVGQVHTAAEARAAIERLHPDLLMLDIYLPDQDGIALLRSLAPTDTAPDTIFITAARDVGTVRAARGLGAVSYLVKPFGFSQLREQLEGYRAWRQRVTQDNEKADQATVDALFRVLPAAAAAPSRLPLSVTMRAVYDVVAHSSQALTAADIASVVGISRPTAQRYLAALEHRRMVVVELVYGATGRPVHWYRATRT